MTRAALKNAEERLREAILASDVDALDALLSDELVLVSAEGHVLHKEDDLELYRSGRMRVTRYDPSELAIVLHGADVGVVVVRVQVAGELSQKPFASTFRFSRTYVREDSRWRIACSHASACGSPLG